MVGFTLAEPEEDRQSVHSVDRHSIASTVATTTSLASRIRDLNLFECGGGEEKDVDEGKDAEQRAGVSPLPEDSEEERESAGAATEDGRAGVALSEEELSLPHSLHLLQRDPPLQVCSRGFKGCLAPLLHAPTCSSSLSPQALQRATLDGACTASPSSGSRQLALPLS
jgi:hypothetical protein